MVARTWKEILHSGDLGDDTLVAELEGAIEEALHQHYNDGRDDGYYDGYNEYEDGEG